MILEKVQLFSTKKEFGFFLLISFFIFSYSLLIEYNNFKNLTRFESALVDAKVTKQYIKTDKYQILKLQSDEPFTFYTSVKNSFKEHIGQKLKLEILTNKISFYNYITTFYTPSKIKNIYPAQGLKHSLNHYIEMTHNNKNIASIYKALYTATPLSKELQNSLSSLGISHLLAISGFHLSVLASLLYLLFKFPYKYLQNRYFPYRSYKLDSFIFISITLLGYLLFLDSPPSLLRAYVMMLIGFFLYQRGYKIISLQTLLITTIVLISLFPRIFFSLGFWLSIAGVFYIFLFLIYFKDLNKFIKFILLPFWVYLMMLPYSLTIFSSFSIYHPLSILWTSLFSIFYPLSILIHLIGFGDFFDDILKGLLSLASSHQNIYLDKFWLIIFISISFLSIFKKNILFILLLFSLFIGIYSIYQITYS